MQTEILYFYSSTVKQPLQLLNILHTKNRMIKYDVMLKIRLHNII